MKNTYIVKQVAIPQEERELPNQKGWDGAIAESNHWRVKMDYTHGLRKAGFKSEDLKYFTDTYTVVADSLDDVFRITNLWEEDESVKRFMNRSFYFCRRSYRRYLYRKNSYG